MLVGEKKKPKPRKYQKRKSMKHATDSNPVLYFSKEQGEKKKKDKAWLRQLANATPLCLSPS